MSDELVLEVAVDRANHKPVVFRFADSEHRYTFTPSDNTYVTLATVRMLTADGSWAKHFGSVLDWITRGLSDEDTEHLIGRLEDPDDPLVTANVQDMYYKLVDAVAGHPTTPSSD